MSTAARIDELRKKFDENPRRYFAPLANELRKAGELAQAIALCREHLPRQPGHMSGYIVFGQALYESGALPEARTVFDQALALDPENLIALRHLGDIALATGANSAARRWYERVLDADPRNEEIAAQLAMLATGLTPALGVAASAFLASPAAPTPIEPRVATPTLTPPPAVPAQLPITDASAAHHATSDAPISASATTPSSETAASETASAEHAPRAVRSLGDALGAFAANDPSNALQSDDFAALAGSSADAPLTDSWFADASPLSEADTGPLDEVPFEEGLIAPEWTDPASLLAAVSAPRAVTPVSVSITPDAVAAFGREPHEPYPSTDVSAHAVDSTADAPTDERSAEVPPLSPPMKEAQDDRLEATGTSDTELPWLAAPAHVDDEAESARELDAISQAFVEDARTVDESDDVTVWAVESEPAISPEASFADLLDPPIDSSEEEVQSAAPFRSVVAPTPLDFPAFLMSDEDEDASAPLPAAVPDSTSHAPLGPHDPIWPAADARSRAYESDPATVDDEGAPEEEAAADSPAFVTETMAELLVSQGFIAQAATVYEELVLRHPYDPVLISRLAELNARLVEEAPVAEHALDMIPERLPSAVTPFGSVTPAKSIPAYPPAIPTPAASTPAYETPVYATPAFAWAHGGAAVITARERFARLAAHRVPRRTPSHAVPAIDEHVTGFAALFGDRVTTSDDDAAARALADAFAPLREADVSSGGLLDFSIPDIEASEGVSAGVQAPAPSTNTVTSSGTASDEATAAGNAGFSFDRFFPDPASQPAPGATPEPMEDPETPVSDDLAQFSAWLKGLGST